jgi:hypothetical protein
LPCKFCFGFFLSDELWPHAPNCSFKEEEKTASKSMKYEGRLLLAGGKFPDGYSKLLAEKVVSKMIYD